jgi:hypothetical protein
MTGTGPGGLLHRTSDLPLRRSPDTRDLQDNKPLTTKWVKTDLSNERIVITNRFSAVRRQV